MHTLCIRISAFFFNFLDMYVHTLCICLHFLFDFLDKYMHAYNYVHAYLVYMQYLHAL